MQNLRILGAVTGALLVAGCGTAAFKPPVWSASDNSASRTDVGTFLRGHVSTYDRMIEDLEAGKTLLEAPIIPAAVIGATGVALGAGTNLPIVLGGGAAGLSGGSAYLRPRDRLALVVQARAAAVCIHSKFNDQVRTALAAGYLYELAGQAQPQVAAQAGETEQQRQERETDNKRRAYAAARARGSTQTALGLGNNLNSLGAVGIEVYDVGPIAVEAAEEIVTRLKLRLANIGTTPDYGTIVTDLRQRFDDAENRTEETVAAFNGVKALSAGEEAQIKKLSEYSARIAECVAKLP